MSPRPEPGCEFILTVSCPDQAGLVHAVTTFLVSHSGNILESQQFDDRLQDRFFMRVHFDVADPGISLDLRTGFGPVSQAYGIAWQLHGASTTSRSRRSSPTTAPPSHWRRATASPSTTSR